MPKTNSKARQFGLILVSSKGNFELLLLLTHQKHCNLKHAKRSNVRHEKKSLFGGVGCGGGRFGGDRGGFHFSKVLQDFNLANFKFEKS
jgi:hypothetical protein